MGGRGSGRWPRTGTKDTTASLLRLDVRLLKDQDQFFKGKFGQLKWGNRLLSFELTTDSILLGVFPEHDNVHLARGSCQICFESTDCNFGGTRNWFKCPSCEGRFAALYLEGGNFACRKCCKLAYDSQLESHASRLITKAQKIRHSLGASGNIFAPLPDKPKGMRNRTYWLTIQRLIQTEKAATQAAMDELYPNKNPLTGKGWRDEL